MSDKSAISLILFSGGMDSTYLLYSRLREGYMHQGLLYVGSVDTHGIKANAELWARNRILSWLRAKYPKFTFTPERPFNNVQFGGAEGRKFGQPISWLVGAMEIAHDTYSEVAIGYVIGDQVLQFADKMQAAWSALWSFTKHGDAVPLNFPLRSITKANIMDEMPLELYERTWVCEDPIDVLREYGDYEDGMHPYLQCGKCVPCITRKLEEHRYYLIHGVTYRQHQYDKLKELNHAQQSRYKAAPFDGPPESESGWDRGGDHLAVGEPAVPVADTGRQALHQA